MSDFDRELMMTAPVAVGLKVLGLLGLVFRGMPLTYRIAAAGLFVTAAYQALGFYAIADGAGLHSLAALTATAVGVVIVQTGAIKFLFNRLQRPLISAAALMGIGLSGLVAAHLRHEYKSDADVQHDTDLLSQYSPIFERVELSEVRATTDRGDPIPLSKCKVPRSVQELKVFEQTARSSFSITDRAIHCQPANDNCNCHGWVFTGGRYIVPGSSVAKILDDNGYLAVTNASPGDLAVYRNVIGEIVHTGIVRYVAKTRQPMVEGKWGWMGVYLHAADDSSYGTRYTFYRSNRDGDVLRGIDGASAPVRFTGAE